MIQIVVRPSEKVSGLVDCPTCKARLRFEGRDCIVLRGCAADENPMRQIVCAACNHDVLVPPVGEPWDGAADEVTP